MFASCLARCFKGSELWLIKCMTKLDIDNEDEIQEIINNYLVGKPNHHGVQETYEKKKKEISFAKYKKIRFNFKNNCEICLKIKYKRTSLRLEMNMTPTASKPLQTIHVDSMTSKRF